MAETPTFGRYAEIPDDEMTPAQQEGGYHSLIRRTRGPPAPASQQDLRAATRRW